MQAKIPVYSVGFLQDDVVVYCGGGGAGRSGVTNAVVAARINVDKQGFERLEEVKLSRDEDAPMTMAVNAMQSQLVCGINNPAEQVRQGDNQPLRVFDYLASSQAEKGAQSPASPKVSLQFSRKVESLSIRDPEQYPKVTVFSPDGSMLAVASTDGQIALHHFPSLEHVWHDKTEPTASAHDAADAQDTSISLPSQDFESDEIYDADFSHSNTHVVFTSSSKLVVYSTTAFRETEKAEGYAQTIQTIKKPALGGQGPCSFRAARFGRGDASKEKLFTVVNAISSAGGKGPKAKIRKSFVTAWDADSWDLIETRHVSDRPVTVFDVSPDGKLLAYGSSDLSVGVLDAKTLRPVLKILDAHNFPPTALRFNPSSTILVSASADNTLRIIPIPPLSEATSATGAIAFITETRLGFYTTIFCSLLIAALALWLQRTYLVQ